MLPQAKWLHCTRWALCPRAVDPRPARHCKSVERSMDTGTRERPLFIREGRYLFHVQKHSSIKTCYREIVFLAWGFRSCLDDALRQKAKREGEETTKGCIQQTLFAVVWWIFAQFTSFGVLRRHDRSNNNGALFFLRARRLFF